MRVPAEMPARGALLLDTDVLVDFLRGHSAAIRFIDTRRSSPLCVSVLTVAELLAGIRGEREEGALEGMLAFMRKIDLDLATAAQGGAFRRKYHGSHGTGLIDALIAATASRHGCSLVTLNRKHFPMLTDIIVPYTKP